MTKKDKFPSKSNFILGLIIILAGTFLLNKGLSFEISIAFILAVLAAFLYFLVVSE